MTEQKKIEDMTTEENKLMSKRKHTVVPTKAIVPAKSAEIFAKKYQELCQEQGFQIVFVPQWAQSKDTGDYRLVIAVSVQAIKKDNH